MQTNETTSHVMTLKEVADYLRCHQSTIYRLIKYHSLPGFKLGADWRFVREEIDRWCQTHEAAAEL